MIPFCKDNDNKNRFDYYTEEDNRLVDILPYFRLTDEEPMVFDRVEGQTVTEVIHPNETYAFLHEAAVISYKGVLFASWYNCPKVELAGDTPIRGCRSFDGGKTWTKAETIASDPTGKILYCPPIYGICDGKLYLMLNQMVSPDHIHSLDCYLWDEQAEKFIRLWSRPIPFKLNTNVVALPNGKLMLPGRIAELDGFPNTPAVLISDSGKIDAEWRLVYIAENGDLPLGKALCHPEISAVVQDECVYMFCRDDEFNVPFLYISEDCGEHWSELCAIDMPFTNSKIYAGTLSDGRPYVMGNLFGGREGVANYGRRQQLGLFVAEKHTMHFTRAYMLLDETFDTFGKVSMWHYPVADEADGKLNIILTASYEEGRGAVLVSLPIENL